MWDLQPRGLKLTARAKSRSASFNYYNYKMSTFISILPMLYSRQFSNQYDSRVVNYDCRLLLRLATVRFPVPSRSFWIMLFIKGMHKIKSIRSVNGHFRNYHEIHISFPGCLTFAAL